MSEVKAFVVDDEEKAINVIKKQLSRHFPTIEIVGSTSDSEIAAEKIENAKPNLLFLDIEMPNVSGFDVLRKFENRDFEVIFVTAYDEYAIEAFKQNAIGYILKPVDAEDFIKTVATALIRVKEKQIANTDHLLSKASGENVSVKNFAVPHQGDFEILSQEEVIYCKADGSYCIVKTVTQKFVISKNLKHILVLLPDWNFIRVNRSFVINPIHIEKFTKKHGGEIVMTDGTQVNVSKKIKKEVFSILSDRFDIF